MDITAKNFMLMDELAKAMEPLDTRVKGRVQHSTNTIFLIAIAGVFAKCQTWNEIADYGRIKIDFFRRFIPGLETTPSHDTFRRFFFLIDPKKLEDLYRKWANGFTCSGDTKLESDSESDSSIKRHIAIDGKRMCSAGKDNLSILANIARAMDNDDDNNNDCEDSDVNNKGKAIVYIVSSYDVTNEISLAQERVPQKRNEIKADKTLIESLSIGKGDFITMDTMGTQKDIVESIVKKGADYLLAVKDNQPKLRKEIEEIVDFNMCKRVETRNDEAVIVDEKAHGYIVTRSCFTVQEKYMLGPLYKKWPGIKTFGVFKTTRSNKNTGEETEDIQYFITSLGKDAASLIMHKRNHWQVENGLHRTLDVEFNEDDSRKKMNSAINYSIITKMVTAVLKRNDKKIPIGRKRLIAGWDENYMEQLIIENNQLLD